MTVLTLTSSRKCFGGEQKMYSHESKEVKCRMNFSVFIPPHNADSKMPVLIFLAGLECTEKNFVEKSGFQQYAAKHGLIVVCPDTSPRDCNIEGENDRWDFGTGAGFYVDATQDKWKDHYRMYSYVNGELYDLVNREFNTNGKVSIFGHSMGGHGAMISALRNPGKYRSVSAFSPICNPCECAWGTFCFSGYLGEDKDAWKAYDSTCLVKEYAGEGMRILIDQGDADKFLHDKQLLPENLTNAAKGTKVDVELRMQPGYDHSYYFISTFVGDHFDYHAHHLA